jgi:sugar phosphate isomerase/epimerase
MAKLTLGVMSPASQTPEKSFADIRSLGLDSCQVVSWDPMGLSKEWALKTRAAAKKAGVTISLFWCGYSGPVVWDYIQGPSTIGLVPSKYRKTRVKDLLKGLDIAGWLGIKDLATHVGFLPLDPQDAGYKGAVESLKTITKACKKRGVHFDFETGQETPGVLLRCIQDVGGNNLGINLDPANLLLYGNANPVDALDIFGKYVRGVHAKDGEYPTDGYHLGHETKLGEGRVDFKAMILKLKSFGYRGPLTIEREIEGEEQIRDIKEGIKFLKPLL